MTKVLIIEDNPTYALVLNKIALDQGLKPMVEKSGAKGRQVFKKNKPEMVLLDNHLPDDLGLDILQWIKENYASTIVIMITSHGKVADAVKAIKQGAYDYIEKSSSVSEISEIIKHATENLSGHSDSKKEYPDNKWKDSGIICMSEKMKQALTYADMVSRTKLSVLLEGETGTGKEVFAKYIHNNSKVSGNKFIAVDCGAIPETLFESEMFGYEKGAFTGANYPKPGKFEVAGNGTLFLDEISNLPYHQQVKLLRIIEERKLTRVGGNKLIPVNCRIITASNVPLEEKVDEEKFKQDLFFRLNEFKITIPPLRERTEDIMQLAEEFLKIANNDFEKNISGFSDITTNLILNYEWPGNIRELKNLVQKAALICQEELINPKHFDLPVQGELSNLQNQCRLDLESSTAEIKKHKIAEALDLCSNNKTKAAEMLGISRRHLYREMKKYKLDKNE